MANGYSLVYSEQAADYLVLLERSRLACLLYDLRKLAKDPFVRSDFAVDDAEGRRIEHLMIGDFIVAFWLDDPAAELRIVEITDIS